MFFSDYSFFRTFFPVLELPFLFQNFLSCLRMSFSTPNSTNANSPTYLKRWGFVSSPLSFITRVAAETSLLSSLHQAQCCYIITMVKYSKASFYTTLLLNEGIPRALKGKKPCLKNPLVLPLIFEKINYFLSFKSEGTIQLEGNFQNIAI